MTTTLILLLLCIAALPLWSASRDAHASAVNAARDACRRGSVQMLDGTVALRSLRLRRDEHGRMRWQRSYEYAYSCLGHDRVVAGMTLLGDQLLWIEEPGAMPDGR